MVVGDDKQIHPTYAGIDFDDVNQLRERYIAELPHRDAYGVNHSFFDLAEIRYQGRIRLREHFRCMPEIIQFSNNLSYGSEPLIPLRQYGAGRLEPTVAPRHVPDGYQEGTGARSVNPPEVEAIVQEIVRMRDDPSYTDKTIGVISLVGDAQAREIETQLVGWLGPEEMQRRQIVCGDAYAFQGDERDVILLSMVSAPRESRRIPAMTDAAAQRRFNVAASRAKDQLYLFHTATLSDLRPDCMRHQLLKYCLDPHVGMPPDVAGVKLSELERLAVQADRHRGNQPAPFDSWFEVDVFLRIARCGYRVIPQFKVAGYRIDLVVQGMEGSLAVECDGSIHTPDRDEADAARQRDLERCGWTFWRVRESAFRLDPDEALDDLWKTLKGHRILPKAAEETRREETKAHRGAASPHDDQGGAAGAEDSSGAQVQEARDTPDGDRDLDQPPVKLGHVPMDQTVQPESVLQLAPYTEWTSTGSVPDPRSARQAELTTLLAGVAEREGPVVAIRAYRLINRASGSQRLTAPARRALNRACAAVVRTGDVVAANPFDREGQAKLVLRSPESPEVILHERGPRELDELPPDEVAMMLRFLREATGPIDAEALKRRALERLGWVRLTRNVSEFLDECIALT